MGRIAFTIGNIVGALATAYFTGNPFMGTLVYSAGETLNQNVFFPLAFPESGPNVTGPRLGDLQVQNSTYGSPIPYGYGRVRLAGTQIWLNGDKLDEHVNAGNSGVKGGGTVTTYSYSASTAFAFCAGPAQNIFRIWGDGKLFWQWDGSDPLSVQEKYPGVVTFYLGTEAQLPDPTIEAGGSGVINTYTITNGGGGYLIGDTGGLGGGDNNAGYRIAGQTGGHVTSVDLFGGSGYAVGDVCPLNRGGTQPGTGSGATLRVDTVTSGLGAIPAFRGLVYIVFKALPLADFANHVPNITAEIQITASPIAVGTILHDLCRQAGLEDAEINTSAVTQEILGYIVGRRGSARGAMQPLLDALLIDMVESDDALVFRPRGQNPVATLAEADLGAHEPHEPIPSLVTLTHAQEIELPERVELLYLDKDRDYQQAMQYGKRVAVPVPTQFSRQRARVEVPMVLTADMAKQQAMRILYATWVGRDRLSFSTSFAWARLDPGDPVTIVLDDVTYQVRLLSNRIGANGLIHWEAQVEDQAVVTMAT